MRLDFADQLPRQVGEDKRRMHWHTGLPVLM